MRSTASVMAAALVLGLSSAAGAQVVIDMPPPPAASADGAAAAPSAPDVGDVAIDRFAHGRAGPVVTSAGWGFGWPYYSYPYAYGGWPYSSWYPFGFYHGPFLFHGRHVHHHHFDRPKKDFTVPSLVRASARN